MKMRITDLLDDYSTDETLPVPKSSDTNLSVIKSRVRQQIKKDEGGFTMKNMKWRTIIVLTTVLVLSLCTVSANALTDGAVFNTIRAWIEGDDGTRSPLEGNAYVDIDGNRVTEYEGIGSLTESADGSSASFKANGDGPGSFSMRSVGDGIDEIVVDPKGKEVPELIKRYKDAETGTYECTGEDGKVYIVSVDENGNISAAIKGSK